MLSTKPACRQAGVSTGCRTSWIYSGIKYAFERLRHGNYCHMNNKYVRYYVRLCYEDNDNYRGKEKYL